jgi:hypothetical protein
MGLQDIQAARILSIYKSEEQLSSQDLSKSDYTLNRPIDKFNKIEKRQGSVSKEVVVEDVIQKSEEVVAVDNILSGLKPAFTTEDLKLQIENKETIKKSFDILSGDILQKAIGREGLVPKKVSITMANGKTHQAIRWVKTGSDLSPDTTQTHKWFHEAGKLGVNQNDTEEEKIHHVVNHPSMTPADKTKHLIHLGIYDKEKLEDLTGNGQQSVYDHLYYAGVKAKEFKDEHKKLKDGDRIISPMGTVPKDVPSDLSIQTAKEVLGGKDYDKFRDAKKKELAAKFGITMTDRWDAYNFKIKEVLLIGYPKSLIAYGTGGVGKTYDLMKNLNELELRQYDDDPELDGMENDEYDYIMITGSTSKTDLWRIVCDNSNKILIFDDCDSMWTGDDDMKNWLKGMLDTTGDGTIRYGNGDKVKNRNGEPCPRTVRFRGRAIFVSNLTDKELPQPLIDSRSSSIDLSMTMDETLDKLNSIKYHIKIKDAEGVEIDASKEDRDIAVDFFKEFKDYLTLGQVNGRTLGQVIGVAQALRRLKMYNKESFYKNALIGLRIV